MDATNIQIQTVETKTDLLEFIKFDKVVYRDNPYWVPPLTIERKALLTKNPFWKHADKVLFLAKRGRRIVGKIEACVDYNYVKFQQERCGFFGFFECLSDYEIAQRLLDTVRGWLKANQMKIMRGPFNPSTNDECGFLLEGFDTSPFIMMPYTHQYYIKFMERYGLIKAKDLLAYIMSVEGGLSEKLLNTAEIARKKHPNIIIRPPDLKNYYEDVKKVKIVYNSSWTKNWGFVPWTDEEFDYLAKQLKPLMVPELVRFAEIDGKPVGFLISLPDYNQVLRKLKGRMGAVEILKFLLYKNKITNSRLIAMGVCPEYRKRGIDALLYLESLKGTQKKGYRQCELSWILEENVLTQRAAEMMGGKLYKKYRIYEMKI